MGSVGTFNDSALHLTGFRIPQNFDVLKTIINESNYLENVWFLNRNLTSLSTQIRFSNSIISIFLLMLSSGIVTKYK